MVKRWIVVGVALLACLTVVGCGVPQEDYDAVVADTEAAKTKVASLQTQLDEVKSDLAGAEIDLSAARSELARVQDDIEAAQDEAAADESRASSAQSQVSSLKSQISSSQSEIEAAEARIAELEGATGAGEEEVAEYVNEEYGFSVKYPKSWEEMTPSHETFVFQAAGPAYTVPGVAIGVIDIEEGVSYADAYITIVKEIGHRDIEVVSESESALVDGTPASIVILQYTHPDGHLVDALALGVEKGGKRISVFVYTINEFVPFSEEQMSEVAHTLRFE